ncbi:hypothetical protein DRQ25_18395 [Candidatus Fermentibacteria bacterium]|nr:MAG: hypothetical protein DRQ25_18395 [Candidatus Fermentibacteria bacterium]
MQLTQETDLWELRKEVAYLNEEGGVTGEYLDNTAEILLRIANVNILGASTKEQAKLGKMVYESMLYSLNDKDREKAYNRMIELANDAKLDPFNLTNKFIEAAAEDLSDGKVYLNEALAKEMKRRRSQ